MPGGFALPFVLAAVVPLLAAADPAADVVGCRGGSSGGGAPDLVAADGWIVERGTSARWDLTFAEPLTIPDPEGRPFRVDVVINDPDVPVFSFAYYRNVNRLVRVDATVEHPTEIVLLPEEGNNVFNPPTIAGRTMTIQVPGRILTDDEDLTGTTPGLERLGWTVIVRDEGACDFLGTGKPTHLLRPAPTPTPEPERPERRPRPRTGWWIPLAVVAALTVGIVAAVRSRFRSVADR